MSNPYKNDTSDSYPSEKKEAGNMDKEIWELFKTGLLAIVLALLIRTFAFEPFNIPSGSMLPNLLVGDYIFVSKYSYGYGQYSFPFGVTHFDGRLLNQQPTRGDVAVFRQPKKPNIDYIKRIVGLPGDKVQVIDGVLHINGQPVLLDRLSTESIRNIFGQYANVILLEETLPNGQKHQILDTTGTHALDNTPVFEVPENHYFAMGDNRDNSQDSRVMEQVGFIPEENLIGRAEFIFFSTNGTARLLQIWKWPSAIRFDRIFKKIQ